MALRRRSMVSLLQQKFTPGKAKDSHGQARSVGALAKATVDSEGFGGRDFGSGEVFGISADLGLDQVWNSQAGALGDVPNPSHEFVAHGPVRLPAGQWKDARYSQRQNRRTYSREPVARSASTPGVSRANSSSTCLTWNGASPQPNDRSTRMVRTGVGRERFEKGRRRTGDDVSMSGASVAGRLHTLEKPCWSRPLFGRENT